MLLPPPTFIVKPSTPELFENPGDPGRDRRDPGLDRPDPRWDRQDTGWDNWDPGWDN